MSWFLTQWKVCADQPCNALFSPVSFPFLSCSALVSNNYIFYTNLISGKKKCLPIVECQNSQFGDIYCRVLTLVPPSHINYCGPFILACRSKPTPSSSWIQCSEQGRVFFSIPTFPPPFFLNQVFSFQMSSFLWHDVC